MQAHFRRLLFDKSNNLFYHSNIPNLSAENFEIMKKKIKLNIGRLSIILIAVCIALVLADLLTKIFEERNGWHFKIIPGFLEVASGNRNPGCAFSFLAEASWGQPFLIAVTFILLAGIVFVFAILPERFAVMKVAFSLICAGAIGNLIDRLAYFEVRDFIDLNMFGNMTSCNLADFWIVLGTALALLDLLFLNEVAVFPLTKTARAAQAKRKQEEQSPNEQKPAENIENDEHKLQDNTVSDDGENNG